MKRLVKVYADWCGPCKVLDKNLQDLRLFYESIDVDEDETDFVNRHNIRNLPTLFIMEDDKELKKITGAISKQEVIDFLGDEMQNFINTNNQQNEKVQNNRE